MWFGLTSRIWENILRYMILRHSEILQFLVGSMAVMVPSNPWMEVQKNTKAKKKRFLLCESLSAFQTSQVGLTNASYTVMEKSHSAGGWIGSVTHLQALASMKCSSFHQGRLFSMFSQASFQKLVFVLLGSFVN